VERLKLYFYREGRDYEYPPDVRAEYGNPWAPPLFRRDPADAARPDGYDEVRTPDEADFIVYPNKLDPITVHRRAAFTRAHLAALPHFARLEHKHLFFNFHDLGQPLCTTACIITDDPACSNVDDPYVYTCPHFPMAHVLRASPDFEFSRVRFDVSFVGTISDPLRIDLLDSIQQERALRFYLSAPQSEDCDRSTSYLHMADERRKRALERLYVGVMRRSWATLCPRGRGSSSIRFYETLCMGRLAVHVSDEYVLPLADRIDYEAFTLFIPEAEAGNAGALVRRWLEGMDAAEREDRCRKARRAWEEHLAPQYAQDIVLDILHRHKARTTEKPTPCITFAPGALLAEAERREYPPEHFANFALDDGRSWFAGGMVVLPGPVRGTLAVNGVAGELSRPLLNYLYSLGRTVPANGCLVELGSAMGLGSILFANALLSRRNLNARVFCVDQWLQQPDVQLLADGEPPPADALEAFLLNARRAGVEFLLHPLRMAAARAAALFRNDAVDLLFLQREPCREAGLPDLGSWYARVRPGGRIEGAAAADGAACAAARNFARSAGAGFEADGELGIFRIRKPGPAF